MWRKKGSKRTKREGGVPAYMCVLKRRGGKDKDRGRGQFKVDGRGGRRLGLTLLHVCSALLVTSCALLEQYTT